jgi:hypothetical protein
MKEEVSKETIRIARETMAGDVRDLSLQWIKANVSWQVIGEKQQQDIIDSVEKGAIAIVDKMAGIMASDGRQAIVATLETLGLKDGIVLKMKCAYSEENLTELGRSNGAEVFLVTRNSAAYSGNRGKVYADPQEPELPLQDTKK